ncbi:MAG: TRM11 family SAM-dependent methyltransferase [Armatimonadota bacterium]
MSDSVDPRNILNELSNRQWLIETKSFWRSECQKELAPWLEPELVERFGLWLEQEVGEERACEMLGQLTSSVLESIAPPRDELKATHPATFSERDVARLIRLFTKSGERVLDPFLGTGSTLLACAAEGRVGVGVELIYRWAEVAAKRLAGEGVTGRAVEPHEALSACDEGHQVILFGDAREVLAELPDESFDFVVTSPPYWRILRKNGEKTAAERTGRGLPTHYSEDAEDLGNIESYEEFLEELGGVFQQCARLLRERRYMCVIVSDFRHGPQFHLYHADVARLIEDSNPDMQLKGLTVLVQDSKNLYPLGIPYAFVSNIHHQFVVILQRM